MNDNLIERKAFADFLLGNYSDVYTQENVDHYIEHSHIAWLAWKARAAIERQSVPAATGWVAKKDWYSMPVLFNPYTGEPRDARDIQSDPQGILIAVPGAHMLAAAPQPQPVQEPVAYAVYWGVGCTRKHSVHFERSTADQVASEIKSVQIAVHPLYTSPQAQPAQPLTRDQVSQLLQAAGYDAASPKECADFINGIRHGEQAHGITKGTT